jgi:hypothetical protein
VNKKMDKIVSFKSCPEMWVKESDGVKPCTIRKIDESDPRFSALRNGAEILLIENTDNGEMFQAFVTDYSEWDGWAIISFTEDDRDAADLRELYESLVRHEKLIAEEESKEVEK